MGVFGNLFNRRKAYYIGTIDELLLEDSIGNDIDFPKKGIATVYVYAGEGEHSHCHIVFDNNNEHDCCICLDKPNYFSHGAKDNTLNSRQMKAFKAWCKEKNKDYSTKENIVNNWEAMCNKWNENNSSKSINPKSIPEYKSDMPNIKKK